MSHDARGENPYVCDIFHVYWRALTESISDDGSGRSCVLRLYLLLLVLQELLLLVVLDLLDLLQLLQLALLLESQLLLLLLLLRQEVSLRVVSVGPNDVGARRWRRHPGGIVVDGLPGVRGGEAVVALGDVRVWPHLCGGVVQYLIWERKREAAADHTRPLRCFHI